MKQMKNFLGALFIIVAIYSMILNLTILFTMVLDKDFISNTKVTEETEETPDKIFISPDIAEQVEPILEYDFSQEGMRV